MEALPWATQPTQYQHAPLAYPSARQGDSTDISGWPNTCIVRVLGEVISGKRIDDVGSGVLVATDPPVVLTASHVVSEGNTRPTTVTFPATGETINAIAYTHDDNADLAALKLERMPRTWPAMLASDSPENSAVVTLVGFDYGRQFVARARRTIRRVNGHNVTVDGQVTQGCSGGPVYDQTGRVCGLIVGRDKDDNRITYITSSVKCNVMRRLLYRITHPFGGRFRRHPNADPPRQPEPRKQRPRQKPADTIPRPTPPSQSKAGPTDPHPTPADPATRPPETTAPPLHEHSVLGKAIGAMPTPGIGWWTALAGMLGIGGPVGLGIGVGAWLISRRLKSRITQRLDAMSERRHDSGGSRYRQYAKSLAANYHNNGGRDRLWDEHLGRIYDEETKKLAHQAEDDTLRRVLQDLRERVERNVSRIFTKGAERTYQLN